MNNLNTPKIKNNKKYNYILIIFIFLILILTATLLYLFIENKALHDVVNKNDTETVSLKNEVNSYKTESEKLQQQINTFKKEKTSQQEKKEESTSKIFGGTYDNDDFSFSYPDNWYIQKEENSAGSDLHRIYLTVPGFIEKAIPNAEHILSISVSSFSFEKNYELLNYNVSKENEENLIISGRESIKRIGKHEFGGYLVVVIIPNGNNAIEMYLRTNDSTYVSQFQTILDSFKFKDVETIKK